MEQLSARRDALIQKAIARSLAGATVAEAFKVPTKCALATALIEAAVSTVLQRGYGLCPDGTYDLANISEAARAYLRTTTDAHHLEQAVFDPEHLQIAAAALRDLERTGIGASSPWRTRRACFSLRSGRQAQPIRTFRMLCRSAECA